MCGDLSAAETAWPASRFAVHFREKSGSQLETKALGGTPQTMSATAIPQVNARESPDPQKAAQTYTPGCPGTGPTHGAS